MIVETSNMPYYDDIHHIMITGCQREYNRPSRAGNSSRRQFLAALAAFGVSTVLPTEATETQRRKKHRLIDLHHHFFPPAFVAAALDKFPARLPVRPD